MLGRKDVKFLLSIPRHWWSGRGRTRRQSGVGGGGRAEGVGEILARAGSFFARLSSPLALSSCLSLFPCSLIPLHLSSPHVAICPLSRVSLAPLLRSFSIFVFPFRLVPVSSCTSFVPALLRCCLAFILRLLYSRISHTRQLRRNVSGDLEFSSFFGLSVSSSTRYLAFLLFFVLSFSLTILS